MPTDCISYADSGYFSDLILDYLAQKPELESLYNRFPTIEDFGQQIAEKSANYNDGHRATLSAVLSKQYQGLAVSAATQQNLEALASSKTFTVTTGHQLNLFTGPLYFLYKIITAINLSKELKAKYPDCQFVPVYWMATEDHDFEEINYFNFKGKKFRWNRDSSGAVGRLSTEGLSKVYEYFDSEIGSGTHATMLKKLFTDTYLQHDNLADATRYLANQLFGQQGLLIIDADNQDCKRHFIPYIKQELLLRTSSEHVTATTEKLKGYKIQVHPREINLFYLDNGLRERIIYDAGLYKINNTTKVFSEQQLLLEVDEHPERFSPNVIMRPLYEEVLLPNLCYIGGAGEIAYWLELKSYFDASGVSFPILLLRNAALLVTPKQAAKAERLQLTWPDLFSKQPDLVNNITRRLSDVPIDFSAQKALLQQQFAQLYKIAERTDRSFMGAVLAQQAKQLKGLDNLEKRLLKAQRAKYDEVLSRVKLLQEQLFPSEGLQERHANFAEFYLLAGDKLIEMLLQQLDPLRMEFNIVQLPD